MRQVALNTHISGTFNIELENLRNSVLTMGGEVEQQLRAGAGDRAYLRAEVGEIRGEYRRRYAYRLRHLGILKFPVEITCARRTDRWIEPRPRRTLTQSSSNSSL